MSVKEPFSINPMGMNWCESKSTPPPPHATYPRWGWMDQFHFTSPTNEHQKTPFHQRMDRFSNTKNTIFTNNIKHTKIHERSVRSRNPTGSKSRQLGTLAEGSEQLLTFVKVIGGVVWQWNIFDLLYSFLHTDDSRLVLIVIWMCIHVHATCVITVFHEAKWWTG